jgi:hypothetical protein
VLSVPVEGDDRFGTGGKREREAGAEGSALALVRGLADDPGAGAFREGRGGVRGAVVDHEDDWDVPCRALDHPRDPRRLVVGRDEREDPAARFAIEGGHVADRTRPAPTQRARGGRGCHGHESLTRGCV